MRRYWLLFSQAVTVLLAAYFVVATLKPEWVGRAGTLTTTQRRVRWSRRRRASPTAIPPGSLRLAAQRASAAVVSINTSKAPETPPQCQRPVVPLLLRRPGRACRRPAWAAA